MSRGGSRPGAGRKAPDGKKVTLAVRISQGARDRIDRTAKKLGWSRGRVIEGLLGGDDDKTNKPV